MLAKIKSKKISARTYLALGYLASTSICPLVSQADTNEAAAPIKATFSEVTLTGEAARGFDATMTQTSLEGDMVESLTPVNNYSLLRLLPGVNGGLSNKDRFGGPVSIRGGVTWGVVQLVDDYPVIDVVPVSAEDGGYTAGLSSIIPSIALTEMGVETGALGVRYGQATGGAIRSQIKRGSAENPYSGLQVEYNTIGEITGMAETSGGEGKWDYYAAVQTVQADYGDAYDTHSRQLQDLELYSGLTKIGYRPNDKGRVELLLIGGTEDHNYFNTGNASDYHTEKDNIFVGLRYDHVMDNDLKWDIGTTYNYFRENRINNTTGLSERDRPQEAFKLFTNLSKHFELSEEWSMETINGVEFSDDYFSDQTNAEKRYDFGETSVYTRNSFNWNDRVTLNVGLRGTQIDNAFRNIYHVAHNVGAAVNLNALGQFHVSHFTGYRLNKAFYLWWGGGSFLDRAPADGLDPSESETLEIGWKRNFQLLEGNGSIRLTYFDTTESRIFNFANTGTGTPYYDEGESKGFEAWLEWQATEELKLFTGYTSLKNRRVDSTNPAATNLDLRFSPLPEHTASLGFSWRFAEDWELTTTALYDSGSQREFYDAGVREVETFEEFFHIDAAVSWQVTEDLMLFGRIENLLNEKDLGYSSVREESDGSTTRNNATQEDPGILFALGARIQF
ncbi:TonB-dependent receptor [Coraliomargarita algicola]|uniref:TonB-dependent receptor n=1 Tax=Coraliomargarita algicola TaxID=3092156 RepID=A0ABZ0RFY5_9BACT|nr:TonB-dependent receptor [Coraliomargarita sp. J2-16]WPJ94321.1 TonB-dependent receptor [Coraliomargarita sp. J2-16]